MSNIESSTTSAIALPPSGDNDLNNMKNAIVEWRRLKDECNELSQEMRERKKKVKALEEIITTIMKNHNIGALDLQHSGGRLLFKKKKRQPALNSKILQKCLAESLHSEQKANEVLRYIQEQREKDTTVSDALAYEKI